MNESGQRVDVSVTLDGNVRTVTVDGVTWNVRVTLRPEVVELHDVGSGELLFEQSPEEIGIRYRKGRFYPHKKMRETILTGFVIAWIKLQPKH